MAYFLTPDQRALLRSGSVLIRALLRLRYDTQTYAFWDGEDHATINGTYYVAAGLFGSLDAGAQSTGLSAAGITITLDATALAGEAGTDLIYTFDGEDWRQRRCEVDYVVLSPETGAVIIQRQVFRGYMDTAEFEDAPGRAILTIRAETAAMRLSRASGRVRSHADQQALFAGDTGLKRTASAIASERDLFWGRTNPRGT